MAGATGPTGPCFSYGSLTVTGGSQSPGTSVSYSTTEASLLSANLARIFITGVARTDARANINLLGYQATTSGTNPDFRVDVEHVDANSTNFTVYYAYQ